MYLQDALGNTANVSKYDCTKREIPTLHVSRNTYEPRTGRLRARRGAGGWDAPTTSASTTLFDTAGNTYHTFAISPYAGAQNPRKYEGFTNYYDASGRLRVVDKQACVSTPVVRMEPFFMSYINGAGNTRLYCYFLRSGEGSVFEEYRYDPLGRRVLVRSRENCGLSAGCRETMTRTVWDGDRILWEIRPAGGDVERDVTPLSQIPAHNIRLGRVAYTFGAALDHPLAVHRFEYRDSMFTANDTSPYPLHMQPLTIYPHTNWRGDYQAGTFMSGETGRCTRVRSDPEDHEVIDGTPTESDNVIRYTQYCLAAVQWAGKYIWLDHSVRAAPPRNPDTWIGSLVHNKRDLTGNLYMRNRYYDPAAGRFTQEDPIGLAGGLNAYGFAAGDPVSYSDPYGLCPIAALSNLYGLLRRTASTEDCPNSRIGNAPRTIEANGGENGGRAFAYIAENRMFTEFGTCQGSKIACSPNPTSMKINVRGSNAEVAVMIFHEAMHRVWRNKTHRSRKPGSGTHNSTFTLPYREQPHPY